MADSLTRGLGFDMVWDLAMSRFSPWTLPSFHSTVAPLPWVVDSSSIYVANMVPRAHILFSQAFFVIYGGRKWKLGALAW